MRKGITLIELVIVVAIIAIITTAALVSFSTLVPKRLEAEARKIVGDLCWARQMAVATHQTCTVEFNITDDTYTIDSGPNQVKYQRLEVDLVSIADFFGNPISPPAQITFNFPSGTAEDRIINLNHQGKPGQVIVFGQTGYVKIQ